jgi:hypothetical protein
MLLSAFSIALQPWMAPELGSAVAARQQPSSSTALPNGVLHPRRGVADETSWFRVYINDPYKRRAVTDVLTGASEWLASEECQSVFSEFRDDRGLPLTQKLRELEATPQSYLGMVIFLDGARHGACAGDGVRAFTVPHSRVVFLCGRDFERASRRNARDAQVTIIHELLHTLGLGESPPSPGRITARVEQLCWR